MLLFAPPKNRTKRSSGHYMNQLPSRSLKHLCIALATVVFMRTSTAGLPAIPARDHNGEAPLPSVLRGSGASIRRGLPIVNGIGDGQIVQFNGLRVPECIPLSGALDLAAEIRILDAA